MRKILFTPYLKKNRFEDWLTHLKEKDASKATFVRDKINEIIQWFEEDLYSNLHRILESGNGTMDTFKAYAPIIAALASASIITGKTYSALQLDAQSLVESEAIRAENDKIQSQGASKRKGGRSRAVHTSNRVIDPFTILCNAHINRRSWVSAVFSTWRFGGHDTFHLYSSRSSACAYQCATGVALK